MVLTFQNETIHHVSLLLIYLVEEQHMSGPLLWSFFRLVILFVFSINDNLDTALNFQIIRIVVLTSKTHAVVASKMSSNEDNDPMAELKAKRKNVREKGGARAEASRNRRKESREKRARANAPENNATNNGGPKGGMGGLKTRFGREEQLKGNAGNQGVGGLGDGMSSDGSSGSDSDSNGSSEGSRLLDGGANKGSRRTRKEVRQSMVTQPVSLKFWKVAGDLDENSGGHVTFPTSTSRLNRDDKKKENQARTKKEANGPGSGFSVDKTPQFAESTAHSTTIGRVRRRLGQELQSDTLPASVTASKSTVQIKGQPINPDEVKENLTSDWFSSSGHIKTLPDPTDARRVMPSSLMVSGGAVDIVKPEEFRTTHNQGMMGNTAGTRGVGSRRSQIVFKFGRIRFSDHKDFKEEDIIAHNLKNLHAQYWKMIATDTESHHLTRVLACGAVLGAKRDEVVQYSLLEQKQGKELMDLAMDMYQAWSEYIGTFRTTRLLEKRVYDEWTRLKGHRETQGISCTSLHLEVRKMALPIDNEEGWNKITNTMRLLEDVLDLLEPKLLEKAPSMTGAGSSMRDRAAANFASFEANEIAVISGKTTSPIFLLSEKHAITSTSSLDPRTFGSEIKRRARIGNCRYYGRVVVNGYPVGKTRLAGLRWPEFELDFGSNMRIEVVRRPELVEFEIYKEGKLLEGSLVDTLVSSVPIALQGPTDTRTSASATAPVFAMYSFSASKSDIPYSSNLQLNGAKKNDGDDDDDDRDTSLFFLPKDGRYTSGRIEVTTSWLGWLSDKTELDGSDLWAPLPPERRDNERARLIGGPVDISGNLASKNNMANGTAKKTAGQHLEGSNLLNAVGNARLDPNDPENTKIMRLLRHRQLSSHHALRGSEPFRVESMPGSNNATFKSRDSTKFRVPERQNLLQLRYQRPHLFHNGKPLPLLDSEILQDPHWKVMLAPKNRLKLLGGQPTEDEEEEEPDYFGFDSEYLIKRQNKMKSFVEKVRLAQLELQGTRRSRGMLSRWVREGILPDFQLDLSFIMDKLAPKRKLKPKVKARKEAPLVKDVYVLVQVSSAFNVPMRRYGSERAVRDVAAAGGPSSPVRGNRRGRRPQSPDRQAKPDVATGTAAGGENPEDDMGGMSDYDDNSDDDEDMAGNARSCNAFVEGSFQGQHPRTSARGGTQPVWNETLRMRFIPSYSGTSSRWTSSNMNQVRDKVRISVFDEQVHQNETDFRHKNSVNERRERRYLGTVSVPFTTIYRRKTIQGLFRLDRPEINLAYETPISPDADDDALGSSERTLKIASAEATCKCCLLFVYSHDVMFYFKNCIYTDNYFFLCVFTF